MNQSSYPGNPFTKALRRFERGEAHWVNRYVGVNRPVGQSYPNIPHHCLWTGVRNFAPRTPQLIGVIIDSIRDTDKSPRGAGTDRLGAIFRWNDAQDEFAPVKAVLLRAAQLWDEAHA